MASPVTQSLPTEPAPLALCASADLTDGGQALVFDVKEYGRAARAFALRFEGRVVSYLNRCLHVPTEMDWQPGEFLDTDRRFIICSIHGALYEPREGRCVGGPCGRGRLTALHVEEREGQVYWYPSATLQPMIASAREASRPDSQAG